MKLVLGSNNPGKIEQFSQLLTDVDCTLCTPTSLGITLNPAETGTTYRANALLKARFYFEQSGGLPTIADDSGIEVEALHGELGVKSRRWGAGADVTDAAWIDYFLKRMEQEENRNARFTSVICYIDPEGREHFFTGVCAGTITTSVQAPYPAGLPLSGCFIPNGYTKVYSALSKAEALPINHRLLALQQFINYITH